MEPIHTIIRNLIDSPTQKGMILDRFSELHIPENVEKIVSLEIPEFFGQRYELSLYGHTEDFEKLSIHRSEESPKVLVARELCERTRERPIMACTKDGRIFFDRSLRYKGMPYKEYMRHIRLIPRDLRKFKEAFDAMSA